MTIELWKTIEGFPAYAVSDAGRVYGPGRWRPGYVKPTGTGQRRSDGRRPYLQVTLILDGKRHKKNVHVLVAEAFLERRPAGKEVAHFDGDGFNNASFNLRWASHGENVEDQRRHGTLGRGGVKAERHHKSTLCWEFVQALRKLTYTRGLFTELAYVLGVDRSSISRAYKGAMWKRA